METNSRLSSRVIIQAEPKRLFRLCFWLAVEGDQYEAVGDLGHGYFSTEEVLDINAKTSKVGFVWAPIEGAP